MTLSRSLEDIQAQAQAPIFSLRLLQRRASALQRDLGTQGLQQALLVDLEAEEVAVAVVVMYTEEGVAVVPLVAIVGFERPRRNLDFRMRA